jgi:hypothetical protein
MPGLTHVHLDGFAFSAQERMSLRATRAISDFRALVSEFMGSHIKLVRSLFF